MFWPAWRLYDGFLMALVFFTWQYAMNARQLRVVYHELGRSKRLAFELEESKAESKRKSFFLNAISHDLRTPLNGLMLQVDLAEMCLDDAESLRESLHEIKACARTTADLLTSFLELGRLDWSDDSVREIHFGLSELLVQVTNAARPLAEAKGLEIRVESPAGVQLRTDRVKVERILQNLVGNAIKFTDHGRVEVVVGTSGRDVSFLVIDSGVGISADRLETIFDEFYQISNSERDSTKGFGLGLSIARRLTRLLQGDLIVTSEVGRGSRFALTLPGVVETGVPAIADHHPSASRSKSPSAAAGAPMGG
jgi:signal transduction histidine kinase